jgi:hypothetical protein
MNGCDVYGVCLHGVHSDSPTRFHQTTLVYVCVCVCVCVCTVCVCVYLYVYYVLYSADGVSGGDVPIVSDSFDNGGTTASCFTVTVDTQRRVTARITTDWGSSGLTRCVTVVLLLCVCVSLCVCVFLAASLGSCAAALLTREPATLVTLTHTYSHSLTHTHPYTHTHTYQHIPTHTHTHYCCGSNLGLSVSEPHHIAASWAPEPGNMQLWIDGEFVATTQVRDYCVWCDSVCVWVCVGACLCLCGRQYVCVWLSHCACSCG